MAAMALALGFAAFVATLLGGGFALRYRDKLHLILGFSSGAVLGVALGFFAFMFLSRVLLLHPEHDDHGAEGDPRLGTVSAASLSLHSFLDGVGIGLAFQVSTAVGAIVAVAVLAHDFSDGINTVTVILRGRGRSLRALQWLLLDALAPVLGVLSTF